MAVFDCLFIIALSVGTGLLNEGISWLLIYRTPEYQKNKREVERLQAKVDAAKKETHSIDKKKVKQKQLQKNEKDLQQINMKLTMTKMKSFFFLMLLMVASYALLNSLYEGQPVVQLPFTPIGFIQGLSHRGLSGEDYTQGSAIFIYVLSSIGLRSSIQKLTGTAPPKSSSGGMPSLFGPMPGQ